MLSLKKMQYSEKPAETIQSEIQLGLEQKI